MRSHKKMFVHGAKTNASKNYIIRCSGLTEQLDLLLTFRVGTQPAL